MDNKISTVRSNNNNVFHHSTYWNKWSRVLFYDAGGRAMLKTRQLYNIPNHVSMVEIDLQPVTPGFWKQQRVSEIRIRAHGTLLIRGDTITNALPGAVYKEMCENLDPDVVNLLLHGAYLPYLDFSKKGETFAELATGVPTLEAFFHQYSHHAGPGLFMEDVKDDWERFGTFWEKKIQLLSPK